MKVLTHPHAPFRVLVLLSLLLCSLVMLGGAGAYFVRKSAHAYAAISEKEFPMLSLIRQIMQDASYNRRAITLALTEKDTLLLPRHSGEFRKAVARNDVNLARLKELLGNDSKALYSKLIASRQNYLEHATMILDGFGSLTDEELRYARRSLDDKFTAYLESQDDLATYCEAQLVKNTENAVRQSDRLYNFFLLLAIWPFLVAVVFGFYAVMVTTIVFIRTRP